IHIGLRRPGLIGGLPGYEGGESKFSRGITTVVESIQLESLHEGADILACRHNARLIRASHNIRYDERRQHTHNDDHHHNLDEGKAELSMDDGFLYGDVRIAVHRAGLL